ncbi:metal-dependent transcriptional regulator [Holdemania massiliensis]|uniref:metal-dependent transcriptional regulator n=1 Tax=Holdemania massiliensis TaxID=1468449 RepID=UPI0024330FD5|nr:metal-dependent transcriptional regulator [Holdemania massiliensis]
MEKMNESSENYLESILILEQRNPSVRMSDIAAMLHVSKPSVNKAMGVLKDAGYIHQEVYGTIHLTESGRQYAQKVYSRHVLFKRFLMEVLEIDEQTAEEDACHMEHCVSDATMDKLRVFLTEALERNDQKQK